MNPYDEQRLRNEVIYLHSLWHQGPPQSHPPHTQNPIHLLFPFFSQPTRHLRPHQPPFAPAHTRSLPPVRSTTFKKNKKKRKRKGNTSPPDPSPEWMCPIRSEPTIRGWGVPKPASPPSTVSPGEKERLAALQLQHKVCQALKKYLSNIDDDDDDDSDDNVGAGWEEFEGFFVRVFMEEHELRGYYQRSFENGEFCCLVCGGIGKKGSGKRYKDCVGLVQHSMSILRTAKKQAHRAFGLAVCKVLGWDIDRLPTVVMKGNPLGMEMKLTEDEGDKVVSLEHRDEPVEEHSEGVDQNISECLSKEGDLNNNAENLDKKMLGIESKDRGTGSTTEVCHVSLVSGAEWGCKILNGDSSSTASGWPSFNTKSSSRICSLSAKEQENVQVLQMQHKALKACQEYLVGNAGSDCDDDEDEDELIDDCDLEECEEFKFFLRLFTENSDLMRYYENNHGEGDFYCLVCGGIGKKIWKRFKDCISLLQHSTAIKRTKRKQAHRAYSLVICKVLGWDIHRLPAIVFKVESLGSSSLADRGNFVEPEKPADCNK